MNHFFGSGLLNAIIWISLGLFVYFKDRKKHLNRKFGLFALSAAIYSLGFSLQAIAPTKVISLFWIRIILMATIFIPIFFLQMVFVATEKEINHKLLTFIYAIAIVFQIINFSTEWFASNPIPKGSFKYLFQAGFLYPALFLFFAVIVTYAFIKLYKAYHNSTGLKRIQLKYLFWAPLIGFTGGSTGFLLGYNCISLYHIISISTYAVSTYGFLIAYAILRYQLLEIPVVIRRTIVFAGLFTFVWTFEGWLYLAAVLDLFSRGVVGLAMDKTIADSLVIQALRQAILRRNPKKGLILHSDRGSQYAGGDFKTVLAANKFVGSMSKKGDCWDNAVAESFIHTLKVELIHRNKFITREEAKRKIFEYVEMYYNTRRTHSALGYLSPFEYEKQKIFS